ncbi:alpha/beta fold hydrolase [Streptomyces hygroscopicus]|uniref:alpha/beta fold hydrolase n=1 Tax=Streptomyces hygroscopicus TaxID=1912 RepID=UPI001FD4307B|nr:alpha/beta hydrolase [Streptomyces hygroscopicus]
MADYVLVAGARLGSWAWDEVVPHLKAAGHGVYPLTLSGLAEEQGAPAGQQSHVQDIVGEVERQDLRDVVLVGHSYSGIPVGQAAERVGDRLAGVVFVDSSVPADGEPFVSSWPDGGVMVRASIAENGEFWPVAPAAHFEGHGLTDEQIARIVRGSTPHPGATLTEPAVLERPRPASLHRERGRHRPLNGVVPSRCPRPPHPQRGSDRGKNVHARPLAAVKPCQGRRSGPRHTRHRPSGARPGQGP